MKMKWYSICSMTLLVIALSLGGCRTKVSERLDTDFGVDDMDQDMEFLHQLARKKVVSNDEAFHLLIKVYEGTDPYRTYEDRVQYLKDHGFIYSWFDDAYDDAVRRGIVAQILCKMMQIQGGLTMMVIGPHPRYATRELVFLGIMSPSSQFQAMDGMEFTEMIGNAEDYLDYKGIAPAVHKATQPAATRPAATPASDDTADDAPTTPADDIAPAELVDTPAGA